MNLYLDASALVKRYLSEPGTPEIRRAIEEADVQGTTIISRAEVSAALAKAVRTQTVMHEQARSMFESFRDDWSNYLQVQVTETVIARAERLAWEDGLRGYDAVHLASALTWKEHLGEQVIFAAFDLQLWEAAARHPLTPFPEDLPAVLETWREV